MAVDLVLHTIDGPYIAFSIGFDLYFMQFDPIPRIFSEDLKPQIIPNLDSWFQAKTHQRHSLQSFKDVSAAFAAGLSKSYSVTDLRGVVAATVAATKTAFIERMGAYGKFYWVEMLDPAKLETVWADRVRQEFDKLKARLGGGFYNYLCRLWKFSMRHRPLVAPVFEKFIARLGMEPQDPVLPETVELDSELTRHVLANVLGKGTPSFKGVPPHVHQRLEILNGRANA